MKQLVLALVLGVSVSSALGVSGARASGEIAYETPPSVIATTPRVAPDVVARESASVDIRRSAVLAVLILLALLAAAN